MLGDLLRYFREGRSGTDDDESVGEHVGIVMRREVPEEGYTEVRRVIPWDHATVKERRLGISKPGHAIELRKERHG